MKRLLFSSVAVLAFVSAFAADTARIEFTDAEIDEGWFPLFDGRDASPWWRGYKKETLPEGWKVENGALVRHGGGDIVTKDKFENFEFSEIST